MSDHDIIAIGPRLDGAKRVMVVWVDGEICSVALEYIAPLGIYQCGHVRAVGEVVGHERCVADVLDLAISVPGLGPLGPEARVWWQRQTDLTDLKLARIRVAKAAIDGREIARICGRTIADVTSEHPPARKVVS